MRLPGGGRLTRRDLLRFGATVGTGSLAGCEASPDTEDPDGETTSTS